MTLVSTGGTTTLGLYDTQSQLEKKADITYVDNKVNPLVGGHKGFATLALAQAAQGTLPSGSVIEVTNDATVSNNGLYLWNGTTLTKSAYDPLTQANTNTEQQLLRSLFARYGTAKNLLSVVSDVGSNDGTTSDQSIVRWVGSSINLNGIFAAIRLTVNGATYPTVATDTSVFAGSLRIQGFVGGTLSLNQNLIRLGDTDIWYYRNTALNTVGITELKVYATPAVGVNLTIDNAVIQNDGGFGFPEIEARNTAIASAVTADYEAMLRSMYREATDRNLLTTTSGTSGTQVALTKTIAETINVYSAACIMECDGAYPANATTFNFKAQVLNNTTVVATADMKRIGTSNTWYVKDVLIPNGATTNNIKIVANVPSGSTTVTLRQAVFTKGGYASPLFLLLDKLASDVTTSATTAATEAAITAAQNTVDTALSGANIGWPSTAFDAIGRASTRRVDIIGIGDSNEFMDGYGFDGALRKALATRFGLYATKITNGAWVGAPSTGASELLGTFANCNTGYAYVPDGTSIAVGTQNGIFMGQTDSKGELIDPTANLRCHVSYGTFSTGSGSFKPIIRREESPYTAIANGGVINTNTGSETLVRSSFDVAASSARVGWLLSLKWTVSGGIPITGNFIGYGLRVENLDKSNGISFTSLYGRGGQSLWDMATTLQTEFTDDTLTNFFNEARRLQLDKNQKPIVVIYLNSGLNDRNETSVPSLGWRASTVGDSPTAYLDNLEAIAKRISDIWQINKWDERELFFWINPSHPVSTPDDAELKSYRKAAYTFAGSRARVSVVDFENITSSTEMLSNGWYKNSGADTSHLTTAGYDALSSRLVSLIK